MLWIGRRPVRGALDRRGQGQIEYGLTIVLVGLFCLLVTLSLGEQVKTFYSWIMERIAEVVGGL